MRSRHSEAELISYLRGELPPPDQERVAAHLAGCADCRRSAESFQILLDELERSVPAPPQIHWGRYQVELGARLETRVRRGWSAWAWRWPLPATLFAGLAGALLFLALQGGFRPTGSPSDLTAFEEVALGSRLDLLQEYALVERLDLLEDFDVIRELDQ